MGDVLTVLDRRMSRRMTLTLAVIAVAAGMAVWLLTSTIARNTIVLQSQLQAAMDSGSAQRARLRDSVRVLRAEVKVLEEATHPRAKR